MKVIDKLNEIKGSAATINDVAKWAYMNRIQLYDIEEALELEKGEFPPELKRLVNQICSKEQEEAKRWELFLNSEVTPCNPL